MTWRVVNLFRFGRDTSAGTPSQARVSISYPDGTARVVLEMDSDQRAATVLRLAPEDVSTLADALSSAAAAMRDHDGRFPMKHSRR